MSLSRWLLLVALAAIVVAFFAFDLHQALSFESVKARQAELLAYREAHPVVTVLGFLLGYTLMGVLPVPGAAIFTVLAGALFGLAGGFLVASFTAALGSLTGFAVARYVLREPLSRRFARQARMIDDGLQRDGTLYLFTLRLLPVLPFFLVNLCFGMSGMRMRSFYMVSQIGMAPGALVFANAGRELSRLDSLDGILSPSLLASFALLATFPWIARALNRAIRRTRSA